MERETTLSLREALKPEHFEFELSKDKKRVTIFLPTESAVAKALTIKKIGETEVQAEEFKPRCQGVIRGIPKEITKEEIKSDLESESNANERSMKDWSEKGWFTQWKKHKFFRIFKMDAGKGEAQLTVF
ncbi:hypothetical protein QYM36_014298 [Artemia franciscana]|uniref:Uncharacterized protein n=1 Tax=Artemia franciscana TaxID=6661 RepID=A0AA88HGR7_ARTSF|nr:hypothetical protein QYM36_014298 [Artemia franciscana]